MPCILNSVLLRLNTAHMCTVCETGWMSSNPMASSFKESLGESVLATFIFNRQGWLKECQQNHFFSFCFLLAGCLDSCTSWKLQILRRCRRSENKPRIQMFSYTRGEICTRHLKTTNSSVVSWWSPSFAKYESWDKDCEWFGNGE